MENLLSYIYQTWRLWYIAEGGIAVGVILGLVFLVSIIFAVHDSGRSRGDKDIKKESKKSKEE